MSSTAKKKPTSRPEIKMTRAAQLRQKPLQPSKKLKLKDDLPSEQGLLKRSSSSKVSLAPPPGVLGRKNRSSMSSMNSLGSTHGASRDALNTSTSSITTQSSQSSESGDRRSKSPLPAVSALSVTQRLYRTPAPDPKLQGNYLRKTNKDLPDYVKKARNKQKHETEKPQEDSDSEETTHISPRHRVYDWLHRQANSNEDISDQKMYCDTTCLKNATLLKRRNSDPKGDQTAKFVDEYNREIQNGFNQDGLNFVQKYFQKSLVWLGPKVDGFLSDRNLGPKLPSAINEERYIEENRVSIVRPQCILQRQPPLPPPQDDVDAFVDMIDMPCGEVSMEEFSGYVIEKEPNPVPLTLVATIGIQTDRVKFDASTNTYRPIMVSKHVATEPQQNTSTSTEDLKRYIQPSVKHSVTTTTTDLKQSTSRVIPVIRVESGTATRSTSTADFQQRNRQVTPSNRVDVGTSTRNTTTVDRQQPMSTYQTTTVDRQQPMSTYQTTTVDRQQPMSTYQTTTVDRQQPMSTNDTVTVGRQQIRSRVIPSVRVEIGTSTDDLYEDLSDSSITPRASPVSVVEDELESSSAYGSFSSNSLRRSLIDKVNNFQKEAQEIGFNDNRLSERRKASKVIMTDEETSQIHSELNRLATERIEIIELLALNILNLPSSLTVELLEAKLNYSIGQTDQLLAMLEESWDLEANIRSMSHNKQVLHITQEIIKQSRSELEDSKKAIHMCLEEVKNIRAGGRSRNRFLNKEVVKMKRRAEIEAFKLERMWEQFYHERTKKHENLLRSSYASIGRRSSAASTMDTMENYVHYLSDLRKRSLLAASEGELNDLRQQSHFDLSDYHLGHDNWDTCSIGSSSSRSSFTSPRLHKDHLVELRRHIVSDTEHRFPSSRSHSVSPNYYYYSPSATYVRPSCSSVGDSGLGLSSSSSTSNWTTGNSSSNKYTKSLSSNSTNTRKSTVYKSSYPSSSLAMSNRDLLSPSRPSYRSAGRYSAK